MKGYQQYMDRQQVSSALHSRLLALEATHPAPKRPAFRWQPVALLAACLCLVLGLSWNLFRGSLLGAGDLASTAESTQAWDADGAASGDTAAGAAVESEPPLPQGTQPVQEESGPAEDTAGSTSEEFAASEESDAAEPEVSASFPLPGWLPEGYVLTQSQTWEDGSQASYLWMDGAGTQISLTYAWGPQASDWPAYSWEDLDWETLSRISSQDGSWGFCLETEDLWIQCVTTGEPEVLWQVVQSLGQ